MASWVCFLFIFYDLFASGEIIVFYEFLWSICIMGMHFFFSFPFTVLGAQGHWSNTYLLYSNGPGHPLKHPNQVFHNNYLRFTRFYLLVVSVLFCSYIYIYIYFCIMYVCTINHTPLMPFYIIFMQMGMFFNLRMGT